MAAAPIAAPIRAADGRWREATYEEAVSGQGTGYLGNLNDEQWEVLVALREEIASDINALEWGPSHYHDVWLARFLRARNFNLKDTAELARENIRWRLEFFAEWDNDRERFLKEWGATAVNKALFEYWPAALHGYDHSNAGKMELYWERVGQIDVKSFVHENSESDILKFHCHFQEKSERDREERMVSANKFFDRENQAIFIEDLEGLGMKHMHWPGLNVLRTIAQIDAFHYVETLHTFYIINAPSIFSVFWKIVKPWVDERTLAKFQIYKHGQTNQFFEDFMPVVGGDRSQMPNFFGKGFCEKHDSCLPKAGVFIRSSDDDDEDKHVHADHIVNVSAGKQESKRIEVTSGALLVYKVRVEARDVDFRLEFEPSANSNDNDADDAKTDKTRTLVETRRLTTDCSAEDTITTESGAYVFTFSNSFSMLRSKQVNVYIAEHSNPTDKEQ